jgi:hypothetical protein
MSRRGVRKNLQSAKTNPAPARFSVCLAGSRKSYTAVTRKPESKKPGLSNRAKCLNYLVETGRIELPTF